MTRKGALAAIKAAGAIGDSAAFMQLYVENNVSIEAAHQAYRAGQKFARFVKQRDAKHVLNGD